MIFSSTFSRRVDVLDKAVEPARKQSEPKKDNPREKPQESPPKWSTLQEIPLTDNRLKLVNEYFLHKNESEGRVDKKYNGSEDRVGHFLNAMA